MADLRIEGLTAVFGGVTALHPTDLTIADGEFIVVVGASGCGKSTLLRLIAGLETPSSGRLIIGGRDMTHAEPGDRGLAMVFQSYALYPHLTVAGNIGFPLRVARVGKAEVERRVARVAAMLGLEALLDRRPRALSGGQRQRVSIGRAIVREPSELLLDEPLSNLDTALRVRMRHEFARIHQELGATMIYVTHDQLEAMTLANRIVVMAHGRVEQAGAPMELYHAPASIAVAETIGSPAINLLPVTIAGVGGETLVRLADGGTCRVAVRTPPDAIGAQATLGVRPEHLRTAEHGPFAGRVELFERLGPLSFVHLGGRGDAGTVVAQLPGDRQLRLGELLRFAVDADDARLFAADGRAYLPALALDAAAE